MNEFKVTAEFKLPVVCSSHGDLISLLTGMMMDADGDQSRDPLRCDEHFPSSLGLPTSDSYMEYGM